MFATNDPSAGGSHLPDVTVVTPVHDESGTLMFFTACRGHHADVGGTTPGSMPPFSHSIEEEGVVLRAMCIVENGVFDEPGLRALLASGPYPARCIADNLSDLKAQIVANQCGVQVLRRLLEQRGANLVLRYMKHVQDNAAAQAAACILALPDARYAFRDSMDDGTPIEVTIGPYETYADELFGYKAAHEGLVLVKDREGQVLFQAADCEPDTLGERLELLAVVRGLEALDRPARLRMISDEIMLSVPGQLTPDLADELSR